MSSLLTLDISAIECRLRKNRQKLISHIRQQLHHAKDPALICVANHIAEVNDEKVADLLGGTEMAILGHELSELRDINLALQCVGNGTYGICVSCGSMIEPARLDLLPAACRCLRCKTAFEKRRGIVRSQDI